MSQPALSSQARPTVLETKLIAPMVPPGLVVRADLVERIVDTPLPIAVVCGPPGYGKTTLLAQCAEALDRPVAWVSLDVSDNDAVLLLTEIVVAFDRIVPVDPLVFRYLLTPEPAIEAEVLPRLINTLACGPELVLILDDVHMLHAQRSIEALAMLCEHLPAGAQVLMAARSTPALPIGRLRGRGLLVEVGPADLALSPGEARQLLEAAHVRLAPDAFAMLFERTEGWPAGLYLAALLARDSANPNRAVREFGGDDRDVFDYLSSEFITSQPVERLEFMLRTSILNRFSASLCDAVLERDDSAAVLADMERSNQFLVALDHRRKWYRYHHLFGEVLRGALAQMEPRMASPLHARASCWHEQHGTSEEAVEHALASHDRRRAAELVSKHGRALFNTGRQATLQNWLRAFSDEDLADYPPLAVGAAWIVGHLGDAAQARRYIRILEHTSFDGPFPMGESSIQSAIGLLKAMWASDGVSQMRAQAELAYGLEPAGNVAHGVAAMCLGANLLLRGRSEAAQAMLEEAATRAEVGASARLFALGLLALAHLEERQLDEAEARTQEGLTLRDQLGLQGYVASGGLLAARACLDLELGDRKMANMHLEAVVAILPGSATLPWLSIYLRILSGRVALALGNPTLGESLLLHARRELARYPDAGVLPQLLMKEERTLRAARGGAGVLREPLTTAERRVLELAQTHLRLEEIGSELGVSRNTVKTHLRGIYGKLNVDNRGDAVARAHALGLLGRHAGRG